MLWTLERSLSDRFFKDPWYWRNCPLSEVIRIVRQLNRDKDAEDSKTRKEWTDKKGKKHISLKVLD